MKIESDLHTASANLVDQIAKCLDASERDDLIRQHCRSIFPEYTYLFQTESIDKGAAVGTSTPVNRAKELTHRQIACLAKSEDHYHIFLLLCLARRSLSRNELVTPKKRDLADEIIREFESIDLIANEKSNQKPESNSLNKLYKLRTTEWRFPAPGDDEKLKEAYRKFDLWDQSFDIRHGFQTVMEKMVLRRISPRYLSLIQKQLEICLDLIRSSDEIDPKYNEHSIQIRLQLKSGRLPG